MLKVTSQLMIAFLSCIFGMLLITMFLTNGNVSEVKHKGYSTFYLYPDGFHRNLNYGVIDSLTFTKEELIPAGRVSKWMIGCNYNPDNFTRAQALYEFER
jgi:hypothetical protein